jgi:ceramide glucosyltransferase
LFPLLALVFVIDGLDGPVALSAAAFITAWYGVEAVLAQAAGWPCPLLYPVHGIARDLLLPALWVDGLVGDDFEWRGNAMTVAERAG